MRVKLWLAEQHYLHQFARTGFQIGEQTDLVERFAWHCVSFVDDGDHSKSLTVEADQAVLDLAQQSVAVGRINLQLVSYGGD